MRIEFTQSEINETAFKVLDRFSHQRIYLLKGPMGAGKTSLVQGFTHFLGNIEDISSPTYSLIQEYSGHNAPIIHMDLYRAKDENELLDIGISEYFDPKNYVFIEWPEKIESYIRDSLGSPYLEVTLNVISPTKRLLQVIEK
jgi:tRNA threonylcarbamoyladenosine biosynthesis protein TsaE